MKIAVIGAGAMGSLFACFLHRAGHEVWLLDKDGERVEAIRRSGLTLEDASGTHRLNVSTVTGSAGDIGAADLVIVFVKSYDTAEALRDARPIVREDTRVLSLQNGLNNLETIAAATGKGSLLGGTTAHGATLIAHGRVRHAGSGDTVIGALRERRGRGARCRGRAFERRRHQNRRDRRSDRNPLDEAYG